jgi:beta-glucosidase
LISRNNVIACAKHFVGDGGTEEGINEGNTISSYEDLERIHMAPYLDCISQGVSTIMASYSSWNGRKLHSDHFLLTEILKEKLGFKVKILIVLIYSGKKKKATFFFFLSIYTI